MTLKEGFAHFVDSDVYKEISKKKDKEGGLLRSYRTRFAQGTIKEKAISKLLEKHGYKIVNTISVVPPEANK